VTIKECAEFLRLRDDYLILTHRKPDGDTLGSAAALALGLRSVGKRAVILENPEITPRYAALFGGLGIFGASDGGGKTIVAVDTASPKLFPDNAKKLGAIAALAIDHHPSNTRYAENLCLDSNAAACGELVFAVLNELGADVGAETATAIYIAVATDTGCFSYGNTTADSFRIASETARLGADVAELNRVLFRAKSKSKIALEGYIYSNIVYSHGGRAAVLTIPAEILARTAEDDLENIAAIPASAEGVIIGITLRELADEIRVSVRTAPGCDANVFSGRFGGGGHAQAAGFSIKQPLADAQSRIAEAVDGLFGK
jgi:phosphoesterase RecJ-like protein